jgi:hypothetical protein
MPQNSSGQVGTNVEMMGMNLLEAGPLELHAEIFVF